MTDEKDPKESVAKDGAEAPASAPTKTAESPVDAQVSDAKPAAATEAPKSVKPAGEAKAEGEKAPIEPEAPKSEKPAVAAKAAESIKPPKPAAAANANVKTPAPGVRVRLAFKGGETLDAPADGRGGLKARRLLAEYDTTADIIHAAKTLRDAGYKSFEAHTPFPIHGMDAAMGLPDSKLGWIVLMCGLTGVTSAWVMMYWMNGVDYPLIIGGKPPGALPSMIPIMFELTVLLSAFGAVFGMFGLNRLPQHHDVLFYSDRFAAFSNDKFFISVESVDPKFEVNKTRQLLEKTHPETIEVIETTEEVES